MGVALCVHCATDLISAAEGCFDYETGYALSLDHWLGRSQNRPKFTKIHRQFIAACYKGTSTTNAKGGDKLATIGK